MSRLVGCCVGLGVLTASLAGCVPGHTGEAAAPARVPQPTLIAEGPPCHYIDWGPMRDVETTCSEIVYDQITAPEAAPQLMGLAFGPDNTLYVVHTAAGEIWAMRDADGDGFMDEPWLVAGGLRLPTNLVVDQNTLYVVSVGGVVRLDDPDGDRRFDQQTVLVRDLSGDTGFWPGGIGIGPDGRLYVSVGAGCDTCAEQRGMLLSYAPDGSDRRIEATGLRNPADFAWDPRTGNLWIVDSGRLIPGLESGGPPGELNRFVPGADYGFPYCTGSRQPDPAVPAPDGERCDQTQPPDVLFPYQSNPSGLAFYTSEAFPFWHGDLLVVQGGSWNLPEVAGYAVVAVGFADGRPDGTQTYVAPALSEGSPFTRDAYIVFRRSFYPSHPVDIAVSQEGWIYMSVAEGRIFRFRPRTPDAAPPGS